MLKMAHLWHFTASILASPYFLTNFGVAPPTHLNHAPETRPASP